MYILRCLHWRRVVEFHFVIVFSILPPPILSAHIAYTCLTSILHLRYKIAVSIFFYRCHNDLFQRDQTALKYAYFTQALM